MELKNKVVLVTGSSQGIGAETALLFAKEGANVVVTYNSNRKKAENIFKECKKCKDAFLVKLNVDDEKSIKECVEKVVDKFGTIDILVNNAGVLVWKNLMEHSNKDIDFQINTNLVGLIKMTKTVLPFMKGQNKAGIKNSTNIFEKSKTVGMIINIASAAGKRAANENYSTYCASKFGVRGFTQALALELPKGIKTFAVNPGMTATQMTDFEGTSPRKVAEIIVNTAREKYKIQNGGDIDIWKHVVESKPADVYYTAKKKIGEIFGGEK